MNNTHIKLTRSVLLTALLGITSSMSLVASQKQSLFYERQTQVTTISGLPSAATTSASATNTAATAALAAIAQTQSNSASSAVSTSSITTARASSTHSGSTMTEAEMKAFQACCAQQDSILEQEMKIGAESTSRQTKRLGENQQEIAEKIYDSVPCLPKELTELIAQYSYEIRGICTATVNGHGSEIKALISLPDGSLASSDADGIAKIWSFDQGKKTWACSQTLNEHGPKITTLISLPDGFLASGDENGVIRIWSPATDSKEQKTWTCLQPLTADSDSTTALISLPDGSLVSTHTFDINIWSLTTDSNGQKAWVFSKGLHNNRGPITALIVLSDGSLAFGDVSGYITILSPTINSAQDLHDLYNSSKITSLKILPDGSLASGFGNGVMQIWSPTTDSNGQKEWTLSQKIEEHAEWVTNLVVLPDDSLASGDTSGAIKIWSFANKACIWSLITGAKEQKAWTCSQSFNGHNSHSTTLSMPSKGSFMSAAYGAITNIVALITDSKKRKYWLDPQAPLRALTLLPDGSLAAGYTDGTIKIWR